MTGKATTITVLNEQIRVASDDSISLTYMVRSNGGDFFITDWRTHTGH